MRCWAFSLLLVLAVGCADDETGGIFADPECPVEPVFAVDDVELAAVLIQESKVSPEYPEAARKERIEGEVVLLTVVSSVGFVCNIQTSRVEPEGWDFETESIRAIEQWRYEPAIRNGVPVAMYVTIFVEFTIHGPRTSVRSAPLSSSTAHLPRSPRASGP